MTLFAEIERLGAAGKVLYTRRAAQGVVWRDEGHRSAASWMAEKTQTGMGEAMAVLETAEALTSLPETTEALRRGELSGPQVKVIAAAALDHPDAEKELLQTAASHSFKGLKERAAQVRAAAAFCGAGERPLSRHQERPLRPALGRPRRGLPARRQAHPRRRGQADLRSPGRGRRPLRRGPQSR